MRIGWRILFVGTALLEAVSRPAFSAEIRPASKSPIDYNRDIRPILSENCYACHGPDSNKRKAGLRLDRKEEAFKKLDSGSVPLVAGQAAQSEVYKRLIATDEDERMPSIKSGKKLTPAQIGLIQRWINEGAVWTPHWSYVPPQRPPVPVVKNRSWIRNPIDNFILAKIESEGLKPSPQADKSRLLRRVTLDLTGLPPTLEEMDAFLHDSSPRAFEKVVERLLESTAYGERMAQFWLDLARYADTNGYHIDNNREIWLWRDWVIKAFNRNMPFDQFTIEQLAGDLLPNATVDQKTATGFNRNEMVNFEGGADPNEYAVKYIVGRVDCTSRVFLGTTMACCECHDHKFDPITQKDYYRFFAFFNTVAEKGLDGKEESPEPRLSVPTPEQLERRAKLAEQLTSLEKEQKSLLDDVNGEWDTGQAQWEARHRAAVTNWTAVAPSNVTMKSGGKFSVLADGSILVAGTNAPKDEFEITLKTGLNDLSGLRLEALPDTSMPAARAGLGSGGDFVLAGIDVAVKSAGAVEATDDPKLGPWSTVGPFMAKDAKEAFTKSFIPETNIDLTAAYSNPPGRISWQARKNWGDGAAQQLRGDNNVAIYVFRTITVSQPREMEVSLGSGGGLTVFLNGRKLLARDVVRAVAPDQDKVVLRLRAGENQLLLKISKGEGAFGFYFQALPGAVREHGVELLAAAADYSRKDFPVGAVLDGKANSGWSVSDDTNAVAHEALFIPRQSFGFAGGSEVTVRLKFGAAALGHFRLSLSTNDALNDFAGLPDRVRIDLFRAPEKRTVAQRREVRRLYRETFVEQVKTNALKVAAAKEEKAAAEKLIRTTMVMQEMEKPRDTFLLVRGDWQTKGEKLLPDVPAVFPRLKISETAQAGAGQTGPVGSDAARAPEARRANRLDLARWLVDPSQPLMSRVTVNRFWQQFFSEGIVRTPADFGSQGEWPTHPELLDWLAREFMESGWDVKHLVKLMVTSSAYQQSAVVDPKLLERDPDNRLFARSSRSRLEAETIRDQALAVAGLLDRRVGGPSVTPFQPPGLWEAIGFTDNGNFSSQKYAQSEGADNYRRGLYVYWKRSMPYASFVTFDAPSREVCTVKRPRTNTPLQALVLMNDPVYVEAARGLARRVLIEGGSGDTEKLIYAFRLCVGRQPEKSELKIMGDKLAEQRANFRADEVSARKLVVVGEKKYPAGVAVGEVAAWAAMGNILLNLDEMLSKN